MLNAMVGTGMNPNIARGLVEMNACRRGSVLYEDYLVNKPVLSNTKLKDFAREFAIVYNG